MGKSMHITRACDYAMRAMAFLAGTGGAPVETVRIAREIEVPPVYLRKVFQALARSGLVKTSAGAGGGVALLAVPGEVSLRQIIEAVEGPITLSDCIEHPATCCRSGRCKVHANLADVQKRLKEEFESRTLADLV